MATNKSGSKKSTSRPKSDSLKHSAIGGKSRSSRPQGRTTTTPPTPSPGRKK